MKRRIIMFIIFTLSIILCACEPKTEDVQTTQIKETMTAEITEIVEITTNAIEIETTKNDETEIDDSYKQYNEAFDEIKAVINNKKKFICNENGKEIYFKEFDSDNYLVINDNGEYEYTKTLDNRENQKFNHFCVIDMNEDGKVELLLENDYGHILLFHYEKEMVFCDIFPFRGMLNLKKDGSFEISGGAAYNYINRIEFTDGKIISKELCAMEDDEENSSYRINGKEVVKEEAGKFFEKQYKKKNAEWYVYNKELTTDELSEFR